MTIPDDSRKQVAIPPEEERTLRQTAAGVAAAVELTRAAVEQSVHAPKVSGYVLKNLLGEGAYGQVWRGTQLRTRKEVAIKVFMQRGGLDWIFLQREVERLSRLDRHPHVVTLLDTDLESEPPFYVMDLIEGGSLHQFVSKDKPASQEQAVHWMEQIGEALSYVHGKGLIHCDLKPANILIDEQSNVRVVDFGQSRVFTESSASLGTLYYMAPEQAQLVEPGKPVHPDVRWDVYALGATIYAILLGRPPRATDASSKTLQQAETLGDRLERYRTIVDGATVVQDSSGKLNRELFAVIAKCLAPDPKHRYEAVPAVLNDLRALRQNRPVSPLAKSRAYRIKKFVQRNPFRIGLVVATMILIPSLYIAWQEQSKAGAATATNIVAAFDYAPADAYREAGSAPKYVQPQLRQRCGEFLSSPAAALRGMGARAGPVVNPEAFWASIESGKLWEHGEWLGIVDVAWPNGEWLLTMLTDKARNGTDHQKYVAFCLMGQIAGPGGTLEGRGSALADLCAEAVRSESSAGVVAAANWAAHRLGRDIPFTTGKSIQADEISGLTFARIPTCADFRRGAAPEDRAAFPDEKVVSAGVPIKSLYVATSETTLAVIEPFVNSVASDGAMVEPNIDGKPARETIRDQLRAMAIDDKSRTAASNMSLDAARRFCAWLNERAAGASPKRRYRLPTEEEWEYACRAGNRGRFCYGDDTRYATYFANCDGSLAEFHTVGQKMPNAYGLFDMHGGLWESCESRFEKEYAPPQVANLELYVTRGGAYYGPAIRCRSTQRNYAEASGASRYLGFRLVMELEGP